MFFRITVLKNSEILQENKMIDVYKFSEQLLFNKQDWTR